MAVVEERYPIEFEEKYFGVPEQLRPREYGRHEVSPEPLSRLVCLSQVRKGINPEIESLKNSIESEGLLNQIDIVLLEAEPFEDYIKFVNRVWHSSHSIEHFLPDDDGFYHLVIAGHSRVESISQNEEERQKRAAEAGYQTECNDAIIWAKVHRIKSPVEILGIQMAENIHKEPSEERRAIALVEMYQYGKENGLWSTQKGFLEKAGDKFTPLMLKRALLFQQLPVEQRELVIINKIQLGVAIEIARLRKPYIRMKGYQYYGGDSDQIRSNFTQLEAEADEFIVNEMLKAQRNKWTISKAAASASSYLENWLIETSKFEEDSDAEPDLKLFDPNEEFRIERKRQTRALRDGISRILPDRARVTARTLAIASNVIADSNERDEQIAEILEHASLFGSETAKYVGDIALQQKDAMAQEGSLS